MRALAMLLLFALPTAFAAPVPKELRKASIVGTWEMTGMMVGEAKHVDSHGHRWCFGADGGFKNPAYSTGRYAVHPVGVDFWFGQETTPALALTELNGDTLRVAFPKDRAVRAADFVPANNNVVYTFQRVKE